MGIILFIKWTNFIFFKKKGKTNEDGENGNKNQCVHKKAPKHERKDNENVTRRDLVEKKTN